MARLDILLGGAAILALIATTACSGDDESAPTDVTETMTEAPATPDTPPADSIDTQDGTVLADFTGDATAGATVFARCRACHVRDAGVNRLGPTLHDIVGREAGQVEGYRYSEANAQSGIIWTPDNLFQFLEDPRGFIPGTNMIFSGVSDPQDRADLIAYLQSE